MLQLKMEASVTQSEEKPGSSPATENFFSSPGPTHSHQPRLAAN